jgi:hypothetical protein
VCRRATEAFDEFLHASAPRLYCEISC